MALSDPVAVYTARNNVEAHLVCGALTTAGVEAHVIEDLNIANLSIAGPLFEIHRPQVWVNRDDVERAQPVLLDYETRQAERFAAERATALPIRVTCEDCGAQAVFDYALAGTVQDCPHCGAYLDVGLEEDGPEEPASEDIQEGEPDE